MTVRDERRARRLEPDLDAEAEVDLRRYWDTVAARWWLLLLGLVAGALAGYLAALGGQQVYRAQAVVYLGQPLGPLAGGIVPSPNTSPATARAIVKSGSVLQRVARDVGLSSATLRSGTAVNPVGGAVSRPGQVQLVDVIVKGPSRVKIRMAANELARVLVERLSSYARAKIGTLSSEIEADRAALAQIDDALQNPSLSTTDKLLLQLRETQVQSDLTQAVQLRAIARDIEAPRVMATAAAEKTTARSRRTSIVVGGLIGLLLGLVAALAWDALGPRVGRRRAL